MLIQKVLYFSMMFCCYCNIFLMIKLSFSQEKRGDREVENLFSILEKLTEIKDSQVEKINKSAENSLPVLSEKLEQALQLCENIEKDYLTIHEVSCHI